MQKEMRTWQTADLSSVGLYSLLVTLPQSQEREGLSLHSLKALTGITDMAMNSTTLLKQAKSWKDTAQQIPLKKDDDLQSLCLLKTLDSQLKAFPQRSLR